MSSRKRFLALMLALVMLMAVVAGCAQDADNTGSDDGEDDVAESTEPKKLRLAGMPADTFNPQNHSSAEDRVLIEYISGNLLNIIYNEETEGVEFIGYHAEDLPETEDNITWTFTLRDGLEWTDGTPITAETYEYTYEMLLDHSLANRNAMVLYDDLPVVNAQEYVNGEIDDWDEVGIKALDEKTLEITLETEMPEIDIYTSFTPGGTSPIHEELYEDGMDEDRTETTYGTSLEETPSSGAYELTEWVRDQHRVFEKNEDDFMADIYVPDIIDSRVITEASTRLQLFENGELDTATVSGSDYDTYSEDPRVVFQEANTVWGFFINSTSEDNPILQNNDLRKALFYGIDRDEISEGVFKVYESTPYYISSTPMTDYENGEKYRDSDEAAAIRPEGSAFDEELAKEYFEKAYEANGNEQIEIEITYFEEQETMKRMTEVAEEQYQNLFGEDKLNIKLRAMPPTAAYDAYEAGDYDMGIGAYTQSAFNPWSSMFVWHTDFPQKSHKFANDEFDELYERTTRGDLLLDPEGRVKALAEMEELLLDYVPQVPIFQNDNAQVFQDRIRLATGGEYIPALGFAVLQADIVEE